MEMSSDSSAPSKSKSKSKSDAPGPPTCKNGKLLDDFPEEKKEEEEEEEEKEEEEDEEDVHALHFAPERVKLANARARSVNASLNMNLGFFPPDDDDDNDIYVGSAASRLRRAALLRLLGVCAKFLSRLMYYAEGPLCAFWSDRLSLKFRQRLTFFAWSVYLPLHKATVGRRTAIHPDASPEYHALTTAMWWGKLFPISISRIRFMLSELHVMHPPHAHPSWEDIESKLLTSSKSSGRGQIPTMKPTNGSRKGTRAHLHEVYHRMHRKRTPPFVCFGSNDPPNAAKKNHDRASMTVTGLYAQQSDRPSDNVVLWIYGGAFLGGDSRGNMGLAEKVGAASGMRDVFVPDYRLVPEHGLDDAVHDVTLAYEYLIYERGFQPEQVTLLGISSGGGLAVILLQSFAKMAREKEGGGSGEVVPMPAGAVLMGPFVDYTEPMGSMKEFAKHDIIVNQSVYDEGVPYLEKKLGSHRERVAASPVYGNFTGLPPLCVVVSEHEVVYDQTALLVERARAAGVDVTAGVWKYMCHVFPVLSAFIPEGRQGIDFICEWIRKR